MPSHWALKFVFVFTYYEYSALRGQNWFSSPTGMAGRSSHTKWMLGSETNLGRVASMLLTAGPYLQRVLLEHKGPEQNTGSQQDKMGGYLPCKGGFLVLNNHG